MGVAEGAGVERLHRVRHVVVVERLVDEPPAPGVDDDHSREGPADRHPVEGCPVVLGAGNVDGRHPPRLAHRAEPGPGPHGHQEAVAGVVGWAQRRGHRHPEEALDEIGAPLETTTGEDHAEVGIERPAPVDHDARHSRVRVEEARDAGAGHELDPGVQAALDETSDERGSPRHGAVLAAPARQRVQLGGVGPQTPARHLELGMREGWPAARPGRDPEKRLVGAQPARVVQPDGDVATGPRPGQGRLVVGRRRAEERDGGVLRQEVQRRHGGLDERRDQLVVAGAECEAAEIGRGVLGRVRQALLAHEPVVRDPDAASGDRGRAAEPVGALDHGDPQAGVGGDEGGGQPGSTGTDDDHVGRLRDRHLRSSRR